MLAISGGVSCGAIMEKLGSDRERRNVDPHYSQSIGGKEIKLEMLFVWRKGSVCFQGDV